MEQTRKKEFAAYYTPENLSDLLCSLAIKNAKETILEPSFGGCSFLSSSWKALSRVGSKIPQRQIFGCDVDDVAFKNLKKNFPSAVDDNFVHKDFLKTTLKDFDSRTFTTVIGNPPFLPISKFSDKELAWNTAAAFNLDISRKASLWAYFVLHSLNFLSKGGNLYFVVPDSLCFTTYGSQLKDFLISRFKNVTIVRFQQRFFQHAGTGEKTAFLLCQEYKSLSSIEKGELKVLHCDNVDEFDLSRLKPAPVNSEFTSLAHVDYIPLGHMCQCKIGIVTGANKYLLKTRLAWKERGVPERFFYPVLSKTLELKGLAFTGKEKENDLLSLIDFEKLSRLSSPWYKRLRGDIPTEVLSNTTFVYRKNHKRKWFDYDDKRSPDLFLSYHSKGGPRLVLNEARINSTNSLHRIYMGKGYKSVTFKKLLCIAMLTTHAQGQAARHGRIYGSVVKLEPGDAKKIMLPIPKRIDAKKVNSIFKEIDKAIRASDLKLATALADRFIFT